MRSLLLSSHWPLELLATDILIDGPDRLDNIPAHSKRPRPAARLLARYREELQEHRGLAQRASNVGGAIMIGR